jgi:hypothetical protein
MTEPTDLAMQMVIALQNNDTESFGRIEEVYLLDEKVRTYVVSGLLEIAKDVWRTSSRQECDFISPTLSRTTAGGAEDSPETVRK